MKTPRWDEVETWAEAELKQALARLEADDNMAERNRGMITVLRSLLALPTTLNPDPTHRIGDEMSARGLEAPPQHI